MGGGFCSLTFRKSRSDAQKVLVTKKCSSLERAQRSGSVSRARWPRAFWSFLECFHALLCGPSLTPHWSANASVLPAWKIVNGFFQYPTRLPSHSQSVQHKPENLCCRRLELDAFCFAFHRIPLFLQRNIQKTIDSLGFTRRGRGKGWGVCGKKRRIYPTAN
jgi:hypothetical protein